MTAMISTSRLVLLSLLMAYTEPMLAHANTVSLASSYSTLMATPFEATCSSPADPQQWAWDGAEAFDNRPQSAAEAMGLTPKVEQYRNGQLIATYSRLGGQLCGIPYRSDNPGMPGSVACGPFPRAPYAAWLAGDVFKVYPAVYKEAVFLGPTIAADFANVAVS